MTQEWQVRISCKKKLGGTPQDSRESQERREVERGEQNEDRARGGWGDMVSGEDQANILWLMR